MEKLKLKLSCPHKLSRLRVVGGGWLENLGIRLSQLPTEVEVEAEAKLGNYIISRLNNSISYIENKF